MSSWQQVLAVDAKFNNFRAPSDPGFKRLYLRRRSHLLRTSNLFKNDIARSQSIPETGVSRRLGSISSSTSALSSGYSSTAYLHTRTLLLQHKYRVSLDQLSHRSSRPPSRVAVLGGDNGTIMSGGHLSSAFRFAIANSGFGGGPCNTAPAPGGVVAPGAVVPTSRARASRAIVGGATLGENYAFSGMHHIFDQHKKAITMVKFGHNDNSLLCCSSIDGTVTICQAGDDPKVLHTLALPSRQPIMGIDWSSSNDLVASCSADGSVCVWQADTGHCLRTLAPHTGTASALAVLFHPLNSNWIVVGGSDGSGCGTVQVVVLSTGHIAKGGSAPTPAPVTALAFNASGSTLWAADEKGSITAFRVDLASGGLRKGRRTVVPAAPLLTGLEHRTWASREARDPSLLVSAACNALLLYSVVDEHGGLSLRRRLSVAHRHHRSLRATFPPLMSFHEGTAVVSGSEDGSVLFLDVERQQRPVVNRLQGHSSAVLSPAFNYTESLLASGDDSGIVIIWKRKQAK